MKWDTDRRGGLERYCEVEKSTKELAVDDHGERILNNIEPDQPETWQPCQQGELRQVVTKNARQQSQQRFVRGMTAGVALLLLVGAVSLFVATRPGLPGGIACTDVVAVLAQYIDGDLDEKLHAQVSEHLEHCEACRRHHREMQGEAVRVQPSTLAVRQARSPTLLARVETR